MTPEESEARILEPDDDVDPNSQGDGRVGKFTHPQGSENEGQNEDEVLTRYEEFLRMGTNGLIEQGAKYAAAYSRSLSTLEALSEVCVALMTKYQAPVWDGTGDPRSEKNKIKAKGYIAAKDKDKGVRDWAGRSEGYQKAIQKIYDTAGVGSGEQQIRNNLKYWRQNLVKKVAPPDQLEALGMKTAKRGAGGTVNQTQKATGATKATGDNFAPVKVMERVAPQVIQLKEDVMKKGVVKTAAEKKKMIDQLHDTITNLIEVYKYLKYGEKADDEEEMTIGAYGFRQTLSAREQSDKEAAAKKDGGK